MQPLLVEAELQVVVVAWLAKVRELGPELVPELVPGWVPQWPPP